MSHPVDAKQRNVLSTVCRWMPILAVLLLIAVVIMSSVYANLSFAVTNQKYLQYFPPFKPYVNANGNRSLGGEYFQMSKALVAGRGFADPFDQPTGPTAWQPPLYPLILAGLLWACDGQRECVMAVIIALQDLMLIGTAFLVLALIAQTGARVGVTAAALVFSAALLLEFRLWFQHTHDAWLVLLAVDLLIAGLCWLRPLQGWKSAAAWGAFGGLCAMVNPIVGLTWGVFSLGLGFRPASWSRLGVTMLVAALTLAPWTIRNYLVFGRFIPVKSNLAFELYQSQCLQPNGLLLKFVNHPYKTSNAEGREYKALGETAYLDRKWEQYCQSIRADPLEFLDRVAARFLAATLWYVPFQWNGGVWPWELWIRRAIHPLPFLALLFLGLSAVWRPLHKSQWAVMGIYVVYLLPYIGASYYDRYAMPLLAAKILMVLWAADRLLSLAATALRRPESRRRVACRALP